MHFLLALQFASCKQHPADKEQWAVVTNFISPDTSYYPGNKTFPFPDSLIFGSLDSFFTNQNKLPTISDSSIIFYDSYRENGIKLCCKQDTLKVYMDSIGGKKYLFAIGEYITVFQSNRHPDTSMRSRNAPVSIPLWNIRLNTAYPVSKFRNDYERLGARYVKLDERFDDVQRQKWDENDSILVETIQFNNSTDRFITALYKDMNENEVNSIIDSLKNKFPYLTYKEGIKSDSDGKPLKIVRINFDGVAISFTQINETEYSFMITDYYETIKLIIDNAKTGYIFRDDVTIY